VVAFTTALAEAIRTGAPASATPAADAATDDGGLFSKMRGLFRR
jgi:hypothetical protein